MFIEAIKIQELNKPNKNNRIYTIEAMNEAISKIKDKSILGKIGMPDIKKWNHLNELISTFLTVNLNDSSHRFTNLRIEDNFLVGDVEILNTPQGKVLQEIIDGSGVDFRIATTCNSNFKHNIQYPFQITIFSINALPLGEGA